MKTLRVASIVLVLGLLAGCASPGDGLARSDLLKNFYGQQRTYKAVNLTGANEISIRGKNMRFELDSPLSPLSVIPNDPNTALAVGTMAKDALLGGLGIYVAGQAIDKALDTPRTVNPQIVQPEVVRPEVVTVPSGAAP